jgi:predicted nucleic acid-binding protein
VRDFLDARFPEPLLRMSPQDYRRFLLELPRHDVTGGAAYDALVAATAAAHSAELITCDRRAAPVYDKYGVRARIL